MRFFLTLYSLLLMNFYCAAQDFKFKCGAQLGISNASVNGSRAFNELDDTRLGLAAGLTFQFDPTKNISFKLCPAYEQKGAQAPVQVTDTLGQPRGTGKHTLALDYLTIPALFQAGFGEKFRFIVNIGPYVGLRVNAAQSIVFDNGEPAWNIDVERDVTQVDLGVCFGLGLVTKVSEKIGISAELRANTGFANIDARRTPNTNIRNLNSNLLLGVLYSLGEAKK